MGHGHIASSIFGQLFMAFIPFLFILTHSFFYSYSFLGIWKKFQITNFNMPNNVSSMKYALESVPGLADVGVPHGDGDGPRTPPRCMEGVWKKFQMTNF